MSGIRAIMKNEKTREMKKTMKAMGRRGWVLVLGLAAVAASSSARGEASDVLGTFGEWTAFADGQGASKLCYMASAPVKKEGKYSNRGEAAVLISHNLADKTFDVVSIVAGYDYQAGEDVLVQVNEKKFTLFSKGDRAWNSDGAADKAMVAAMKKGNSLIVVGTSNRGTRTTDNYSLSGFTKAYEAINKACPETGAKPAKAEKNADKKTDK